MSFRRCGDAERHETYVHYRASRRTMGGCKTIWHDFDQKRRPCQMLGCGIGHDHVSVIFRHETFWLFLRSHILIALAPSVWNPIQLSNGGFLDRVGYNLAPSLFRPFRSFSYSSLQLRVTKSLLESQFPYTMSLTYFILLSLCLTTVLAAPVTNPTVAGVFSFFNEARTNIGQTHIDIGSTTPVSMSTYFNTACKATLTKPQKASQIASSPTLPLEWERAGTWYQVSVLSKF